MGSVILLSGGMDSVVAAWASRREHEPALTLTFDYGQRAAVREHEAALNVSALLGVPNRFIKLPWLAAISGASITDGASDPAGDTDASAWVPGRNAVFVSIATALAEGLGHEAIVCGFNAEEAAEFPDNSPEFVERMTAALELATRNHVRVIAPTVALTKAEILRLGAELGAPLHLIWSCYGAGDEHCWRCPSCRRLRAALESVGQWRSFAEQRAAMRRQKPQERG